MTHNEIPENHNGITEIAASKYLALTGTPMMSFKWAYSNGIA